MMYRISFFLLLIGLLAWSCKRPSAVPATSHVPYLKGASPAWIDSLLASWSLEQKAGQLLLWEGQAADTAFQQNVHRLVRRGWIGGVQMDGYLVDDYLHQVDSLQRAAEVPLFVAARAELLLTEQFDDLPDLPSLATIHAAGTDSLYRHLRHLLALQARYLGVNLVFSSFPRTPAEQEWDQLFPGRTATLNRYRILTAADRFDDYYPGLADTSQTLQATLHTPQKWIKEGVGGLSIPVEVAGFCADKNAQLHTYLREKLQYDGLVWTTLTGEEDLYCLFQQGYDAFRIHQQPHRWRRQIVQLVAEGKISEQELDQRLQKILRAKSWVYNGLQQERPSARPIRDIPLQASLLAARTGVPGPAPGVDPLHEHFSPRAWTVFHERLERQSITFLHEGGARLPLSGQAVALIDYSVQPAVHLHNHLQRYLPVNHQYGKRKHTGGYDVPKRSNGLPVVILGEDPLRTDRDAPFLAWLRENRAVVLHMGPARHLSALDTTGITLLQAFERSRNIEETLAEILVGARGVSGRMPFSVNSYLPRQAGIVREPVRLGYSRPEELGLEGEQLVSIDAIMARAMRRKAMPGGQVLIAKAGRIIYHKAFGRHTYEGAPVDLHDVYDLASLTKALATTMGIMYLYEQEAIDLDDRLRDHLPELADGNLRNITIRRLLTHRSGIQPHLPVIPYLLYRGDDNTACDSFFCRQPSDEYPVQVAEGFYFRGTYQDSIWTDLNDVDVRFGKRFQYSDVNFVLLQKLVERKTGQSLDQWLDTYLYGPLGLERTLFRPLERLPKARIVPTEQDSKWRRQLLQGYVHDETAGLLGGVAGHAGLFSNTGDIAVLLQMLLNEGEYGGQRFFQPETVRLFRSDGHGNHRGLGFDKPIASNQNSRAADVSAATFGHTGFTGTCFWVDPEEELVYVFLSNRVYPSSRNRSLFRYEVRADVHQEVYDALHSFSVHWPGLPEVDSAPPPLLVQRTNPS